ncbi:MAG: Na+/H+ antiporter subunit E [Amphiplicatus sp.]
MGRLFILGLTLAAVWLLLSGYFDKPLLLGFGAASVAGSLFLARRAGMIDEEGAPFGLLPRILGYWIWLGGEIGKANVAVARQALALQPKLSPKMIRVPMTQRTNAGRATFANSITLTPGTVSVDLERDHILVHALAESFADEAGIALMGMRVTRTEGASGEAAS